MTKVRLIDDIHVEWEYLNLPVLPEDNETILILAGDVGEGTPANIRFVEEMCTRFKHVVYVLGNHEFYGNFYDDTIQYWIKKAFATKNLHVLHNQAIVLEGIKILGTTLWTDVGGQDDWFLKNNVKNWMADFHMIYVRDEVTGNTIDFRRDNKVITVKARYFHPDDYIRLHKEAVTFLETELAIPYDGKVVVVTHHLPIPECTHPKFVGSPMNCVFHANLNYLFDKYKIDYWFFGHTHEKVDFKYKNTILRCNPKGYGARYGEGKDFDPVLRYDI